MKVRAGFSAWVRSQRTALVLGTALGLAPLPALAQTASDRPVIERHPVIPPPSTPGTILITPELHGSEDSTPYGIDLAGVTLIGEDDRVPEAPAAGVTVGAAPAPDGMTGLHPALTEALTPLIGRPLSPRAIAGLQATVARVYRDRGLPFVSVTTPPQEITAGVLSLRVIAFRSGAIAVRNGDGTRPAGAEAIRDAVRLMPGQTIDARQLGEDLDWLNRDPYRRVGAVFSPGEATALSDLSLDVTDDKPWTVSAGWSNSGSEATGYQRYSLGVGGRLPVVDGMTVSYLLTGGSDFFRHPTRIALRQGNYPVYLSQAARIVVPTAPRQQIEFTPDIVVLRQEVTDDIAIEQRVFELPLLYRSAVSNILPGRYWGDVYGGLSYKALDRRVYFLDTKVAAGRAELLQFSFGWTDTLSDAFGRTGIDLRLEANPAALIPGSDDAAWSAYTNGRVTEASYLYGVINLTRRTDLPGDGTWDGSLTGVLSGAALPDTERLALGGTSGSRAYGFSQAAVDRGVIWRNTLRAPAQILPLDIAGPLTLSPYLLGDAAWGQDVATRDSATLVSLGAGLDLALGGTATAGVSVGRAMTRAGSTASGDWTVAASFGLKF